MKYTICFNRCLIAKSGRSGKILNKNIGKFSNSSFAGKQLIFGI